MIFYKIDLNINIELQDAKFRSKMSIILEDEEISFEKFLGKTNSLINNKINNDEFIIQAYQVKDSVLSFVCGFELERDAKHEITKALDNALKLIAIKDIRIDNLEEITAEEFVRYMNLAESTSEFMVRGHRRKRNLMDDFDIDYLRDDAYQAKEYVFNKLQTREDIFAEAKRIMADESLLEELKNIFSYENTRQFYGIPVHYKIVASSRKSAKKIIEVLVGALGQVNRVLGTRVNYISDYCFDCMLDESALESLFEKAQGATTVMEMYGASDEDGNLIYSRNGLWMHLEKHILKYKRKNLFIFVELLRNTSDSNRIVEKFADKLDVVEIREGIGDKKDVEAFILNLMKKSKYKEFVDEGEIKELLDKEKVFNVSTAFNIYDHWYENVLKDKVYPSYKPRANTLVKKVKKVVPKNASLNELDSLIGLEPVKMIVRQMLATYAMQKTRKRYGIKSDGFSRHMIFTGNPGVAKTSVARLLSGILASEGITENDRFIECGRSDLVGKYVGWTAPAVKKKFWQARGGILFIDEAYALVESHNSFGSEAINTIVQEMENHRDDVIVIFAGYPEKMREFLDKNEGLQSRIAFHVDFPDYSPEELVKILELMAKNKSYVLDEDVKDKCKDIFERVYRQPEFGNGRFVRNILEQAIMKQSMRIYERYRGKKISKKEVCTLRTEDFGDAMTIPFGQENNVAKKIGFIA